MKEVKCFAPKSQRTGRIYEPMSFEQSFSSSDQHWELSGQAYLSHLVALTRQSYPFTHGRAHGTDWYFASAMHSNSRIYSDEPCISS